MLETAEAVGWSVEETASALRSQRQPMSLDEADCRPTGKFLGGTALRPPRGSSAGRSGQEPLENSDEEVLEGLSWRDREILKLHFGLGDGYAYTLDEIGRTFAISRERVRQIEARALRALQQPTTAARLVDFV